MTVKLQTQNPVEILHTQNPPRVRHLIQSQKTKTADSEKRSLGYETMTTVSDLDSEVWSCNRSVSVSVLYLFHQKSYD